MSYPPHEFPVHYPEPVPRLPHSAVGVASFVLAILTAMAMFCLFAVAGYLEATRDDVLPENSVATMMVGFGIIGCWGMSFLGIGLGIAGILQPYTDKTFSILGLTIAAMALVGSIGLCILGMMVS